MANIRDVSKYSWEKLDNFDDLDRRFIRERNISELPESTLITIINQSNNLDLNNKKHKEVVTQFLNKLSQKDWKDALSQSDLNLLKYSPSAKKAVEKIKDLIKKDSSKDLLGLLTDFLNWKMEEEKTQIVKATTEEVNVHKKDVEESLKTSEITDSSVEVTFWFWNEDFKWLAKNINKASYDKMIRSMDNSTLTSFYRVIKSSIEQNNRKWDKYSFTPFNIGRLKKIFEKQWYKADWNWGWIEMASLIQLVENVYFTQEKLKKETDFREKLAIILDYNQDWLLDNKVNFVTKEKQFFDNIKSEEEFSNLLLNLWYKNINDFWNKFNWNYFAARKDFKDRLWTIYLNEDAVKLSPDDLTRNPEALKEYNKFKKTVFEEVDKQVENKFKDKTIPKETKELIKLQAIWVILWSSNWIWASFDVKKATKSLIDSAWVGVFDWVPWVFISKEIIKWRDWKYSVNLWLANFVPFVWASLEVYEWNKSELKKLFPTEFNAWAKITLAWWATLNWAWIWVWISNLNEKTKAWIELAKKEMRKVLDKVFVDIKKWKDFEESWFKDDPSSKFAYNNLKDLYESSWKDEEWLKEWALRNYENYLYENANSWIHFSWIWIWLAFANWFIYPSIWVNLEKHSTTWGEQKTVSAYTEKTEAKIDIPQASFDKTDLDGKLKEFESAFSWRTRYNTWAKNFLNPKNDLNTRWNWLTTMANKTKALRDAWLPQYLARITDNNDKRLVISTLSQYTKKANDFNNWDISKWNSDVENYINTDKKRRKSFDTLFWFSLENEANEYYDKLKKWKRKIWKMDVKWISFDATASKAVEGKDTVTWVDVLYTNLSMLTVNWEPLLVKIDDSKVNKFKETVQWLQNMDENVKKDLINKIDKWQVTLYYYKDPEGFNDRIIPYITTPWVAPWPWTQVYGPEHNTQNFGIWFAWKIEGEKKKEVKQPQPEEPTPTSTSTKPTTPTPKPGEKTPETWSEWGKDPTPEPVETWSGWGQWWWVWASPALDEKKSPIPAPKAKEEFGEE